MNNVVLCGRLASEPEIKYTNSGKAVCEFNLAVDRGYGEKKQTSFITCQAWEKRAETIGNTLVKGHKVVIEGEWAQQSWETKEGQKRRKDYCLINNFEYADSKQQQQQSPFDSLGKDVFPETEIPF